MIACIIISVLLVNAILLAAVLLYQPFRMGAFAVKVGDKVYQTDGIRTYESTIREIEISSTIQSIAQKI